MKIGCVILAGGKSSRMGRDKANLEFQGETFLKKLTRELDFFEEKLIAGEPKEGAEGIQWTILSDIYKECGPMGGLHSALANCKSDALFCMPCDLPLLESSLFEWLRSNFREEDDAVICVTPGGRQHPLCGIYRKSVASVLEAQIFTGNYRMRNVLEKIKVNYVEVDTKNKEMQLFNVNTPQDYCRLKEDCE